MALRIRNRFLRAPVPHDVVAAVEAHVAKYMPKVALAVRSSAPGEDSKRASFAGLHDNFVGVFGAPAVVEAIRGVWTSLWSDRALLYRRELGIDVNTRSVFRVTISEIRSPAQPRRSETSVASTTV